MKTKPIEIREGNVVVKIYATEAVKNGQTCTAYAVSDYSEAKRKLRRFANLAKARIKAKWAPTR